MNARLLPDYRRTLTVSHRWLIVSLGIVLGLLASACANPLSSSATSAEVTASDHVVVLIQEYRS
jgi:hypothetical protein